MMRRILSLLLVPLVLASQGAVFVHSHSGISVAAPARHAARPHFHIREAGHAHHHGDGHSHKHSHGKVSGRHGHHDGSRRKDTAAVAEGLIPVGNHDDDAVFVPEMVTIRANRLTPSDAKLMQGLDVLPSRELNIRNSLYLAARSAYCQPPSLSLSGGPLYLRTLALRL